MTRMLPMTGAANGSRAEAGAALRFWNNDILADTEGGLETVLAALRAAQTLTRLAPLGTLSRDAGEGQSTLIAAAICTQMLSPASDLMRPQQTIPIFDVGNVLIRHIPEPSDELTGTGRLPMFPPPKSQMRTGARLRIGS